jgi:hypothetical protein
MSDSQSSGGRGWIGSPSSSRGGNRGGAHYTARRNNRQFERGNVFEIPANQEGIMPGYEFELSVSSPSGELSSLCNPFAGHFCHVPVVTSSAGQAAIPDSFTPAPICSYPIPEVPLSGIRAQKAGILKQASGVKPLGQV